MKTKSIIVLLVVLVSFASAKSSSLINGGKETAVIQTSAQCGECKEKIETALLEINGVSSAKLDMKTKKVTVVYNPDKVTLDQIKSAISKTGYDADDVKADATAYQNLPACCKKGGHE